VDLVFSWLPSSGHGYQNRDEVWSWTEGGSMMLLLPLWMYQGRLDGGYMPKKRDS